jgi:nicotinamidase-related amidase
MTAITTRALIIIDVQNEYEMALPIAFPPFAGSVANIGRAMDFAREQGLQVIVVQQNAPATSPAFAIGSKGHDLHPVVASRPRDHLVQKTLPSAFTGTDLELYLRARGITTLTICGYMSHNCNLSTVLEAVHKSFTVEYLSDATGSLPYANLAGTTTAEEMHRVVCVVLQSRFAAVATTDEWIASINSGTALPRDNILASSNAARGAAA